MITAFTMHRPSLQDIKVPWSECMGSLCLALKQLAGSYDREPGMLVAVHASLQKTILVYLIKVSSTSLANLSLESCVSLW